MAVDLRVIAGAAGCGKTTRLLQDYRKVLASQPFGSALWLAPTHRAAQETRQRLLDASLPGCFSPQCLTFDHLARRVLEASPRPMHTLGTFATRQLLGRLVRQGVQEGRITYFAPIANSPGFLDQVVGVIGEWKRLEIWPEEIAAAFGKRPHPRDQELCFIYREYQRLLNENDLYDAAGRFWSARAALRAGQLRPFERLAHVFVDGFTDFTRTEHEILEILASRVRSMTISLPYEPGEERSDLFAKPAKTLQDLRSRHADLVLESMPRRTSAWQGMDHLERYLFSNPRRPLPAADTTGIQWIAAAGTTHEIELIARHIKHLLTQAEPRHGGRALRPSEILVVFRSLADNADLVREVFQRFGVPVAIGAHAPLAQVPILSALLAILRLEAEDWPFRQMLALVTQNYFRPAWREWQAGKAALAAERAIRRLAIPAGRAELLETITRIAQDSGSKGAPRAARAAREDARLAAPLLARLAEALDALPTRGTMHEWAAALEALAADLGLTAALTESDNRAETDAAPDVERWSDLGARDQLAWDQLLESLRASDRLCEWLGEAPAVLNRRELLEHLQDALRSETLARGDDENGRVRVLPAESARNLAAPVVFLAGLSEKAFPASFSDNCLHGDADARKLIEAGLPVVPRAQRSRFEMLLFYEVLTRATRQVVLSYPALDQAAQPLSPSPYLAEVRRICGERPNTENVSAEQSLLETIEELASPRDVRLLAASRAIGGDGALLGAMHRATPLRSVTRGLVAGLQASHARAGRDGFGAYEGLLLSPEAGRVLAERYGPEHCWSPSQLEQYAHCPFQFFMQRVLGMEEFDEPGLAVDFMGRGRMMHWILSTLHRRLNERAEGGQTPREVGAEQLWSEIQQVAEQLLAALRGGGPLSEALLELDARKVLEWLAAYPMQHAQYDETSNAWPGPLRPAYFEVAFGPRHGESAAEGEVQDEEDPLSRSTPFVLDCGEESIRFSGRIDRIDVGSVAGQPVFSIIDYKSSAKERTRLKAVHQGLSFQLPLYALAAEWLLKAAGALPYQAGYWHVADKGCGEPLMFHVDEQGKLIKSEQWVDLDQQLRQRLLKLVQGIRRGEFQVDSIDKECTSQCAFNTVCRVNHVRSLGKGRFEAKEPS